KYSNLNGSRVQPTQDGLGIVQVDPHIMVIRIAPRPPDHRDDDAVREDHVQAVRLIRPESRRYGNREIAQRGREFLHRHLASCSSPNSNHPGVTPSAVASFRTVGGRGVPYRLFSIREIVTTGTPDSSASSSCVRPRLNRARRRRPPIVAVSWSLMRTSS